jgi:hypothetical protein
MVHLVVIAEKALVTAASHPSSVFLQVVRAGPVSVFEE